MTVFEKKILQKILHDGKQADHKEPLSQSEEAMRANNKTMFDRDKFKLDITGGGFVKRRGTTIVVRQTDGNNIIKETFSLRR